MKKAKNKKFVLWFKDVTIKDVPLVGGKNASLGEMYVNLDDKGVDVPNGFAVTAFAYHYLLKKAGIKEKIKEILKDLDSHNMIDLAKKGKQVRDAILQSKMPPELAEEIINNYKILEKQYGPNVDVAVRSSATAEDLPDASFAGQQETFLDVKGQKNLLKACQRCFASLFTNRAISYREDKKFDHFSIGLSIAVQKMVRADKGSSGVMFSIDTESGFKDAVLINGSWGLGENIVQGNVTPDEFYVFKSTLGKKNKKGKEFNPIISKKLGPKHIKMIYNTKGKKPVKNIPTTTEERHSFVLNDKEIIKLAKWAVIIEEHYSKKAGHFKPMDMEWAKDGITGKLFIVQARPETVVSQRDPNVLEEYSLKQKSRVILTGSPVGSKIGHGRANVIMDVKDITQFKKGDNLVTDMTDPDWEPIMKIASSIVTDRGGRTCHAAIVSRELGIPCIVGTGNASKKIKDGEEITVSCAEGEVGKVYKGVLKYEVKKTNIKGLKKPKTKVMLNIGDPDLAFSASFIPNDGVGLAREEFIINSFIKIHPLALINYAKIKDAKVKKQIDKITKGYDNKKEFYVQKLAYGIGMIASAFYPKDVIVRLSDFKSNEYANLIGGAPYEPTEDNPMIGWRGASRYYEEGYQKAFELECKALKRVREDMGLNNVKVMVPFCRTVEEGKKVIKVMENFGLKRGVNNLEVYVMCEIPSNVILAEEYAKIFDGFSIGTNDLTQLILGVDRDSELVSHIYDERNQAVKTMVSQVIKAARKNKRKIGICGQAPSDFPDFAQFLVKEGIDSISLNPDTVIKTTMKILEMEKKIEKK